MSLSIIREPLRLVACLANFELVDFIDRILNEDQLAPRKQRHTAHRIWVRLREEQPANRLEEATVREYVLRKQQMGINGREVFVPQSYELGQEGQVDWLEAAARLDGRMSTLQFFAMRSMASRGAFHGAYTNATQQAFLEGDEQSPPKSRGSGLWCKIQNAAWAVGSARG